jgi:acyl dehydratase
MGEIPKLYFEDATAGASIPAIEVVITCQRVIMNAAVTWDWFPGHHDQAYAQQQGQRDIYVSTLFLTGFVDRCITEWAGPEALVRRRKMKMLRAICAGERATALGKLVSLAIVDGRGLAEVDVEVFGDGTLSTEARVTVELPHRSVDV